MESSRFCLGLDYGTNTARALIFDASCGAEIAGGVAPYSGGQDGILTDPADPLLARQAPLDYEEALISSTREAIELLAESRGPSAKDAINGNGKRIRLKAVVNVLIQG